MLRVDADETIPLTTATDMDDGDQQSRGGNEMVKTDRGVIYLAPRGLSVDELNT